MPHALHFDTELSCVAGSVLADGDDATDPEPVEQLAVESVGKLQFRRSELAICEGLAWLVRMKREHIPQQGRQVELREHRPDLRGSALGDGRAAS